MNNYAQKQDHPHPETPIDRTAVCRPCHDYVHHIHRDSDMNLWSATESAKLFIEEQTIGFHGQKRKRKRAKVEPSKEDLVELLGDLEGSLSQINEHRKEVALSRNRRKNAKRRKKAEQAAREF